MPTTIHKLNASKETPEPLNIQTEAVRARSRAKLPREVTDVMTRSAQELERSGIADLSLRKGDQAPDFELPSATGNTVRLSQRLERGPAVLSFYRGGWCPYCNIELRALQRALPQFEELGASLVAISPQTPDSSLSQVEKEALTFDVLSDGGNKVARQYGLVFTLPGELRPIYESFGIDIPAHNGDNSFELPVPATYVIGPDRNISYDFVNTDYVRRAEPEEILKALKRVR